MRDKIGRGRPGYDQPILLQFDATRDTMSTFYVDVDDGAGDHWRDKHWELCELLG